MIDANIAQMIVGARLHRCSWIVDEPSRVLGFLPEGTRAHPDRRAFAIQYVIDNAVQTTGLGAHSATLAGIELDTMGPDGVTPTRLITHAIASTPVARRFYAERGCLVSDGVTTLSVRQDVVTGETRLDGTVAVIRTSARVGAPTRYEAGYHDVVLVPNGRPVISTQPWVATVASTWAPLAVDFMDPSHGVAPLQPARDHVILDGTYSPNASWCVPAMVLDRERYPDAGGHSAYTYSASP